MTRTPHKSLISVVVVLLICLETTHSFFACSWDYSIWQIRSKKADPLYRFIKKGKAGFIDQRGKVVVPATLDFYGNSGDEFFDGLLLTGIANGPYINTRGQVVLDTGLSRNWSFSEGLAAAMRDGENKWGFISKDGKFAIEPRFESYPNGYVYSFADGLAMVHANKEYGFIDKSGEFRIRPRFLYATSFAEGRATVVTSGPCFLPHDFSSPCPESRSVGEKGTEKANRSCKFGYIDRNGDPVTPEEYDVAGEFSEGLAAVQRDGKWGYIDIAGDLVIPFQFDQASDFSDGMARVGKSGKKVYDISSGYIDRSGKLVIPYQFETADHFSDGLAPVGAFNKQSETGRFFYVNKSGIKALPGTYKLASPFFKGLAHVKLTGSHPLNGDYAYINSRGQLLFRYSRYEKDDD